jgi:hypothetical protein
MFDRFKLGGRGKRLHHLCAVHPWMQGRIVVK